MDIRYSGNRILVGDKYLTLLDQFVLDFIRVLEPTTPYVIVSGYVAILFGRSRGTEDIDILISRLAKDTFGELHTALSEGGYEFLNAEDADGLYDMLLNRMGIRIAKKGQFIPNIELKFLKDDIDRTVLRDRVEVNLPGVRVYISPIDIQIAYKMYLGSQKDIEDALYLWEIFKDDLNHEDVKKWMKTFGVRGDEYGIVV
jgi:succinate dehydrogenase flavin-adding protein (antitoxin of CptAB toxin-antitoxin module)